MVMEMAGQFEARNAERQAAEAEQRQALLDRQAETERFRLRLRLDQRKEDRLTRGQNFDQRIRSAEQALDEQEAETDRSRLKPGDIIQLPEDRGGGLAQVYENTMTGRSVVSVPGQGQVALEDIPGATIADKGTGTNVTVTTGPMGGAPAETASSAALEVELPDSAAFLQDMSDQEIQDAVSFLGSGAHSSPSYGNAWLWITSMPCRVGPTKLHEIGFCK
jgi:hypothetical protein